jgi:hypothetical protein
VSKRNDIHKSAHKTIQAFCLQWCAFDENTHSAVDNDATSKESSCWISGQIKVMDIYAVGAKDGLGK